ncbi:MAG: hypothetical protein ACREHC_04515, partial [Candidatus Levyibacteriota bacterium]
MQNTHFKTDFTFFQLWDFLKVSFLSWTNQNQYLINILVRSFVLILCLYLFRKVWLLIRALKQEQVFLELTPPALTEKTAYTTQQLFSVLHNVGSQRSFMDRLLGKKNLFSFEIVSTRTEGIRYLIKVTPEDADIIKRNIISYLPQAQVKEVKEYLPEKLNISQVKIIEFKLKKHFAFPLAKQNILNEHDPVAYITGMMTKLLPGEFISFQILVAPTVTHETALLTHKILNNEDVLAYLNKSQFAWYLKHFT